MKTVLPAKENIAKLWGHPKPKDTPYRLMKYLLQCEVEEGTLLHNVVTGHLILLTKEEAESLSHLPANQTELTQELIADHFLVPQDFDEYRSVNQLRKVFQSRETGDAINHYVILPTTFCNAHCFYCYESDYPRVHMTEETANKIIDYIVEHRKDKEVKLGWFGGEPLLGVKRIDQISQGLKDRNIPFYSSMISNGYLFDEELIQRSVALWSLNQVQITLDGTEEVYNGVKAFADAKENPYQRVLRNIDLLSEKGIYVAVRLNLDFYNRNDIQVLLEELTERYKRNQFVKIYISLLYNDKGYEPVHHSEKEYLELLQIYNDYSEQLLKAGVGHDRRRIPELQVHQCIADDPHSIVIQPDGGLCRCEHESIADSFGNISEGILNREKLSRWLETKHRSEDCPKCSMYPFCYNLQSCIDIGMPCNESIRKNFQIRNIDKLFSEYQKRLEDKKDENIQGSRGTNRHF